MSLLLEISRIAVLVNLGLLLALGYVWVGNYRLHGALHTLALSVFAGFLFVQNVVWLYLYVASDTYIAWFVYGATNLQVPLMALCVLETFALAFLAWITWR